MNKKVSWDHSLVKKYSSSNHFKLLNQLKNEVKKYPLKKKINILSDQTNSNKIDSTNTQIISGSKELANIKDYDSNKDSKSTINFNNSKNFSIYKAINNDNKTLQEKSNTMEELKSSEENLSLTFKDRLNQIDMK